MVNYPKEITGLRQWICWRLEPDPKSEKPRKIPYDPKTGRKASSTNPDTWASLAEAQAARDKYCLLYTSPSPRDQLVSRMPSSA